MPQALVTLSDISQAAFARIERWSPSERLKAFAVGLDALASQNNDSAEKIIEAIPADGRDRFSGACAVLAILGIRAGNHALAFQAGHSVLNSQKQSARGRQRRGKDALGMLIAEYLREFPHLTPKELWGECQRRAESWDEVLTEATADSISYAAEGERERTIGFEAFRRRVQRIQSALSKCVAQVRQ